MPEKLYATMELSLDDRRRLAVSSVRHLRSQIQKMADADLMRLGRKALEKTEFLNGFDEDVKPEILSFLERVAGDATGTIEEIFRITWTDGVELIRSLFGNEATDFALNKVVPGSSGH